MVSSRGQRLQVKKSLRYSILDGSAFSMMQGLTQDYIIPFALALKATTFQVSLLTSIPSLAMSIVQLVAPGLTEKAGSRKGLILPAVLTHALLWLPILLIPYLLPGEKIWWLVALFTLSVIAGTVANPAWGSLMADLVPMEKRGKYFGLRGRICALVALIFFFIGGTVLHFSSGNIFLGFSVLFGGAVLFRLISYHFLSRMYEPPMEGKTRELYSLKTLVKSLTSSNIGRFIIFVALISFATGISLPFFAVFMLRDLKFDYLTFVAVNATVTLSTLVFLPFWGRRADTAGNIKVLRITSMIIPIVPVLWLVNQQLYCLIPIQILSGFGWSGFNLVSANFLYDASDQNKRTHIIALSNAMNGGATCLGALLGGLLVLRLPPILGSNLLTIFLVSGILRGIIVSIMVRRITEVRHVPKISTAVLILGKKYSSALRRVEAASPVINQSPQVPGLKTVGVQGNVIKRAMVKARSSISIW